MRLIVIVALLTLAAAERFSYEGYQVFSVFTHSLSDVKALRALMFEDDNLDFWEEPNRQLKPARVMVAPEYKGTFQTKMQELGLVYTVYEPNVQEAIEAELKAIAATKSDPNTFMTNEQINAWMQDRAENCPADRTCEVYSIGRSVEGRETYAIRIAGNAASGDEGYWIDGTVHAREWLATMTTVKIVEHLTSSVVEQSMLNFVWYILPVANPDGYVYSWTTNRMWRKNRGENSGTSCVGTDLNRNFAFRWGREGVSHSPCSDIYCGSEPASEIETQNMQNEILNIIASGTNLKALVTIHSYGRMWMHPWGNTVNHNGWLCERADDHNDMFQVATAAANAVEATHNSRWARGTSCEVIYQTTGATDDWAKGVAEIKYTFNPELRGTSFVVNPSEIQPSFEETWNGVIAMVNSIESQ